MLVSRIRLPDRLPDDAAGSWPFTMPCVAALAGRLELTRPVTPLGEVLQPRPDQLGPPDGPRCA
jgi:hypothetical protein